MIGKVNRRDKSESDSLRPSFRVPNIADASSVHANICISFRHISPFISICQGRSTKVPDFPQQKTRISAETRVRFVYALIVPCGREAFRFLRWPLHNRGRKSGSE